MNFSSLFSLASTAALLGWLALVFAPRRPSVLAALQYGLVGALALAYAGLAFASFFRVEGGGFNSIAQVRALFESDFGLVAGWIHYLAFDLFVGLYIARESDALALPRLIQALLLLATFMIGPVGLLLFYGARAAASVERPLFGETAQ